jgi:hypothetical protein
LKKTRRCGDALTRGRGAEEQGSRGEGERGRGGEGEQGSRGDKGDKGDSHLAPRKIDVISLLSKKVKTLIYR